MRSGLFLSLIAASLTMCSCSNEDGSALVAPGPELAAGSMDGELRIIKPSDGAVLTARATFTVEAVQQVRGGPVGGRGQVQYASAESDWSDLGAEFPWSAQDHYFTVPSLSLPDAGQISLRLIVYEFSPDAPFLVSIPAQIRCVGWSAVEVALQ
jgi:hypothetical protein